MILPPDPPTSKDAVKSLTGAALRLWNEEDAGGLSEATTRVLVDLAETLWVIIDGLEEEKRNHADANSGLEVVS